MKKIYLPGKQIKVADVIKAVADAYGYEPEQLVGERGSQHLAFARHIAMFLAYRITHKSLQKIGDEFGGRDHTAVIHARKNINRCTTSAIYETPRQKEEREALMQLIHRIETTLKND